MIILSSPSGAGKSTLARRLVEWDLSIKISISATTRPPRDQEKHGREYFFVTEDEFSSMVAHGKFLEHAVVFGHRYGTPSSFVDECIENSKDVVFDIDWQGGQQLKNSKYVEHSVSIFVLPPSIAELYRRLSMRGKDSHAMVGDRMEKCRTEISHWLDYDYVLINHEIESVLEQIKSIVKTERLKRVRQIGLSAFVAKLNREIESNQL